VLLAASKEQLQVKSAYEEKRQQAQSGEGCHLWPLPFSSSA
jgi:hypothetical protein